MDTEYYEIAFEHYKTCWEIDPNIFLWNKGPYEKLPFDFRVLEFAPRKSRTMWTYATCGMSDLDCINPIELHIFSTKKDESIVELLTAATYYHRTIANVSVDHTINFGRPWQNGSKCEFGLISLPYLDGPTLENLKIADRLIKFNWLIPITKKEVEYKKKYGVDALETKLEEASFNYLDPGRKSVI